MNQFWLLAEDNEDDALMIRRACARLLPAPTLHWVRDGVAAQEFLTERLQIMSLPDLVLSDLNMPQLNGLELLSWVKKQVRLQHVPFILLTSSVDDSDRNFASQLGAQSYFTKPSSLNGFAVIAEKIQLRWCVPT